MDQHDYRHLFGPVPSRRLGRSLGVDLVPFKTCSFDCIFCQLGKTTRKTLMREEYVPTERVLEELGDWLDAQGEADYITLAGSGEPTLHSRFGQVIEFIRRNTAIPVALLTNGSLLTSPDVRAQAAQANVVKVSLGAWDQASLEHLNRPHRQITFESMIKGYVQFRRQFKGELWLEVFLAWGTNATPQDVSRIALRTKEFAPDKIQLNTCVRPPCEDYAYAVPEEKMASLARLFEPLAEVVAEYDGTVSTQERTDGNDLWRMIERRPCTLDQVCQVFGWHRNEATKHLGKLARTGRAQLQRQNGATYFAGVHEPGARHANI